MNFQRVLELAKVAIFSRIWSHCWVAANEINLFFAFFVPNYFSFLTPLLHSHWLDLPNSECAIFWLRRTRKQIYSLPPSLLTADALNWNGSATLDMYEPITASFYLFLSFASLNILRYDDGNFKVFLEYWQITASFCLFLSFASLNILRYDDGNFKVFLEYWQITASFYLFSSISHQTI